jgi:hypothetical protein
MDQTAAEKILAEHGLAELLPARLVARRRGCTVWQLGLFAPYGDASAEVQIYPLREDPVSVVDLEEEITAMGDSSERTLVRELRDSDWGILVTCDRKDEALFQRFFQEGIPKERTIAYHPQLDRILGEDMFRQEEGRWIKTCLASVSRAMQLRDLVHAAEAAYQAADAWKGKLERPFPVLYTILQLPFQFQGATPEYNELAQMVFGITTPEPVEIAPPVERESLAAFARQLFGSIAALHFAGICFSRDAGSCLRPEFLAADGSLLDVYYLCKPEHEEALRSTLDRDNWNALNVICGLSREDVPLTAEMITIAIRSYTGRSEVQPAEQQLIRSAAEDVARGNVDSLRALLKTELFSAGRPERPMAASDSNRLA